MRLKQDSRGLAARSAEMLRAVGGNVLGVIVNGAGHKSNYGYGHSNYSYYGKDSYGASAYGCYGYGATVKDAAGYYLAAPRTTAEVLAAVGCRE